MYNARVLQVLITSPSDVQPSIIRKIYEIIENWNRLNSANKNMVLRPLRWEKDVYSIINKEDPQTVINKQIVKESDILIGVFWTRIGTRTKMYTSGSVEEIEEHIKAQKPAMLYFLNKKIPQETLQNQEALDQYHRLEEMKLKWERDGVYKTLNTNGIPVIFDDLSLLLNNDPKIKRIVNNSDFGLDPIIKETRQFEYNFLPGNDGKRVWYRQSLFRWVEKSPNSAIPDKVFLCYGESTSIVEGVRGMIVQCATKDEPFGFQVFIPEPNESELWLYCRIVNKRGSDWKKLGVSPIVYF